MQVGDQQVLGVHNCHNGTTCSISVFYVCLYMVFVVLNPKKPVMEHCPNNEFMGVWLSWSEWYVHCTIN